MIPEFGRRALTIPPRRVAAAAGVGISLVALAAYLWLGNPKAPEPQARVASESAHAVTPEQIAALAERLEARLKQVPDDAAGWVMLARSQMALGRFEPAARSYAQAARLSPDNAAVLADYADALAMARGRKLDGEPFEIAKRALAIDPGHVKSLALAGSAEFERKNYAAAVAYWERIVPLASANSEFGRAIRQNIANARELGGLQPGRAALAQTVPDKPKPPPAIAVAPNTATGLAGAGITGTVTLAPALASKIAPEDALFIFARAAEGARSPLAIVRVRAGDLPYAFRLDDSQAMHPNARVSGQPGLVVIARISKAGNAIAKPGDLEGSTKPVAPGASGVELVIDQVRQ